jgi:hypothetical protein
LLEGARKNMREYEDVFGLRKFGTPEDLIKDIARRNCIATSKAKVVHPPMAKITLEYD